MLFAVQSRPERQTHGVLIYFWCVQVNFLIVILFQDVLILSQFVRPDGCMMPQRITGLCKTQQKRMSKLVSMAHKAGNLLSSYVVNNFLTILKYWTKFRYNYLVWLHGLRNLSWKIILILICRLLRYWSQY